MLLLIFMANQADEHRQNSGLIPLAPEQPPVTIVPKRTTELPFFYLTKKKGLLQQNISYEGVDEYDRPIRWKVRPNRAPDIGEPAIDAHRIWVLLILPAIEHSRAATGRVSQILPLGGVRKCLRVLDWGTGGHQARRLLRALNQIGAAWCEADFFLPVQNAGKLQLVPIKGKFSRLAIYAIGEKHLNEEQLAAGKFDFDFDLDAAIYLELHSLEMAIQETEERRYTDNQYMFSVEPTARRWLEIMGPKLFGVLWNAGTHCEIRYSWYVKHHHTLQRLQTRSRVVSQMNRVVADHIASGYILKPEYLIVREANQEDDFLIRYIPGPMARQSTNRIRSNLQQPAIAESNRPQITDSTPSRPRQRRFHLTPVTETQPAAIVDYRIVAELAKRGVGEADARQLLATLPPGQPILDQLKWGDLQVEQSRGKIQNPPGFYISLLQRNVPVPATSKTSRGGKTHQKARAAQPEAFQQQRQAAQEAEEAERQKLDSQIAALPEAARQALFDQAKAELLASYPGMAVFFKANPEDAIDDGAVRARMRQLIGQRRETSG